MYMSWIFPGKSTVDWEISVVRVTPIAFARDVYKIHASKVDHSSTPNGKMSPSLTTYTLKDVAQRDGTNGASTWVVIHDLVYDVTKYKDKVLETLRIARNRTSIYRSIDERPYRRLCSFMDSVPWYANLNLKKYHWSSRLQSPSSLIRIIVPRLEKFCFFHGEHYSRASLFLSSTNE